MKIFESAENYLETIYMLSLEKPSVRAIDIVNDLGFSKPSVSIAMKQFRENGYIEVDGDGFITLTEKGLEIALRMYERHEIIARILMAIGVSREAAYTDSCKVEHHISDETFECLKKEFKKLVAEHRAEDVNKM